MRTRSVERGGIVSQVVTYRVDDATIVKFEIEPPDGFQPAGPEEILGRVREAVDPAVEAAKAGYTAWAVGSSWRCLPSPGQRGRSRWPRQRGRVRAGPSIR